MDYDLNYQEDTDVDPSTIANKIGDECSEDGTYECTTCGEEAEYTKGTKFPGCEHCGDDHLTWQLVGAA